MTRFTNILISFCAIGPVLVSGKGFLRSEHKHSVNASTFNADIQDAISEVQGCGGRVEQAELDGIRAKILPMWLSLPKSSDGRIERPFLRHIVHRYFRHHYSFIVRGFEESRPVSDSDWNIETLLSERVPAQLEAMLTSQNGKASGFDLEGAVSMIAVIEKLIFDQEVAMLDQAYEKTYMSKEQTLDTDQLHRLLKSFMLVWTLGDRLPEWNTVDDFVHGQIKSFDFQRQKLSIGYNLDDARQVASQIIKSFGSFYSPICDTLLRAPLEDMDLQHTGRVPLTDFYAEQSQFAESVEHLRAAGALDETGKKPQVLLANYIVGTSNCFISTSHYSVCCSNPCEGIHGDIERAIGTPAAAVKSVLDIVGSLEGVVSKDLRKQLDQIAENHGGQIPLHSRLFAQWLHYVFPRECPFPHIAGSVVAAGPDGRNTPLVSEAEKKALQEAYGDAADTEEEHWMSQWSAEEELMTDNLKKAKSGSGRYIAAAGALLLLVLGLAKPALDSKEGSAPVGHLPLAATKAHLV